jgi:uncharacterized membrane protein
MISEVAEAIGIVLELAGVVVIALAAAYATGYAAVRFARRARSLSVFQEYRRRLGRGILLGLEFLVAGDIINTVAIRPSFHSVGLLSAIVLIRTFLSFALEVEMTGRWPWQREQPR